jgi:phosphatidylglycerophosphatase A
MGERWFLLLLIIAATCVVSYALPLFTESDPGEIVIDEVVGMFVTFYLLPLHPVTLVFGFVLFRIFDIVKPLGIGYAENISGSVGIIFDDIVAGIYAHICLTIVLRFF